MRDIVQVVLTSEQAISIFLEKYKEGNFPSQTAKSIEPPPTESTPRPFATSGAGDLG